MRYDDQMNDRAIANYLNWPYKGEKVLINGIFSGDSSWHLYEILKVLFLGKRLYLKLIEVCGMKKTHILIVNENNLVEIMDAFKVDRYGKMSKKYLK